MKKFCSKCGAQLDLAKRTCITCQAFNPYFIAGFKTSNNDNIQVESIAIVAEHEIAESNQIIQATVMQKENAAEIESLNQKQQEQQKAELELKNEILKVKEETEQYKKETFDLVKEVQRELHDIEAENKLLKEKVELLKNNHPAEQVELVAQAPQAFAHKQESKKAITTMAAIMLLIVVTTISYFFFSKTTKPSTVNSTNNTKPVKQSSIAENKPAEKVVTRDTTLHPKLLAAANTAMVTKALPTVAPTSIIAKPAPAPVSSSKAPSVFYLTEARLKTDLIGKKLSGCDITINNSAEINSIGNLVLVDRLSASYLKYKCIVKVKQGNDTYTSSPYIYYSAEGTFIKVDGTNCE